MDQPAYRYPGDEVPPKDPAMDGMSLKYPCETGKEHL